MRNGSLDPRSDDEAAQTQALGAILWCAGVSDAVPDLEGLEPDVLARALRLQRVLRRFVRRASGTRGFLTEDQRQAVAAELAEEDKALMLLKAELGRLGEVLAARGGSQQPPVLHIKGNAAAHHLRSVGLRRWSGDVDLLVADPVAVRMCLESAGYDVLGEGICHEESALASPEGVHVDIHRYFPAWSYRRGVDGQPMGVVSRRLEYRDSLRGAIVDPEAAELNMFIPSAALAALILCLHMFMDYVEAPFLSARGKLRIGELLEFASLTQLPEFDAAVFCGVAEVVEANDAWRFVAEMCTQLRIPFRQVLPVDGASSGAQELARGLMIPLDADARSLIARPSSLSPVLDRTGVTTIRLRRGESVRLGTTEKGGSGGGTAVVLQSERVDGKVATHSVFLSLREDGDLGVRQMVEGATGFYKHEASVMLGTSLFRTQREASTGVTLYPTDWPGAVPEWKVDDGGWSVECIIPSSALRHAEDGHTACVEMICQVHRFLAPLTDDWNAFFIGSLQSSALPLRLYCA